MTTGSSAAVAEVLAQFPELRRLRDMVITGWTFIPIVADGEVIEVRAVRVWPKGWSDALRVAYVTDAGALRCDPQGGVVWQHEGTLAEVVDSLVELPEPGSSAAPYLVIGRAPALWTPPSPR